MSKFVRLLAAGALAALSTPFSAYATSGDDSIPTAARLTDILMVYGGEILPARGEFDDPCSQFNMNYTGTMITQANQAARIGRFVDAGVGYALAAKKIAAAAVISNKRCVPEAQAYQLVGHLLAVSVMTMRSDGPIATPEITIQAKDALELLQADPAKNKADIDGLLATGWIRPKAGAAKK